MVHEIQGGHGYSSGHDFCVIDRVAEGGGPLKRDASSLPFPGSVIPPVYFEISACIPTFYCGPPCQKIGNLLKQARAHAGWRDHGMDSWPLPTAARNFWNPARIPRLCRTLGDYHLASAKRWGLLSERHIYPDIRTFPQRISKFHPKRGKGRDRVSIPSFAITRSFPRSMKDTTTGGATHVLSKS